MTTGGEKFNNSAILVGLLDHMWYKHCSERSIVTRYLHLRYITINNKTSKILYVALNHFITNLSFG